MSDPEDGFGRYWLGLHLFTETEWYHQLLNTLGHAGIGLLPAAAWGALACFAVAAIPLWTTILIGVVPTAIREVVQFSQNKSPHLMDRTRDALEGAIGGFIAFAIYQWGVSAC